MALLVILIWGSNFVVIKIGVSEIEPLIVLGLRFFFAGLIFLPFMKWPGWTQARMIMLVGLLMGPLHQGFLYVALETMPAGSVSIILKSNVLMVTLMGWFFLKEHVGWRTWTGILVGFVGVFILMNGPELAGNPRGLTYTIASAFFVALAYIAMKKVKTVHAPTYIALMSFPIFPLIFAGSYVIDGTEWMQTAATLNWDIIAAVVAYQAIVLSASHMIWQWLVARYPVSQVVPWTLLLPLFGVIGGIIFFDEALTKAVIVGGGLVVVGVSITTFRRLKKKRFKMALRLTGRIQAGCAPTH